MKKATVFILILLVALSGALFAQEENSGKTGLFFEAPLDDTNTIGAVFEVKDNLFLKPFLYLYLDFDAAWNELAGTAKDHESYRNFEPGIAVDKVVVENGPLSVYFGVASSAFYYLYKDEPDGGDVQEISSFGFSIAPRIGTEYMFTDSFGIYGNLQLNTIFSSNTDKITDPTGTVTQEDKDTSFTIRTLESSLGAVFYFE